MDRKINKKNKQNPQFRKEEIKLFLFAGDIILGTKNLREFTKNKIVRTINSVKVQNKKSTFKNQLQFYKLTTLQK